ncbi:MAG: hypothetical protein J5I50_08905 [Chitinophagaceae bacterium]|nr:hypothetical protein [Chitinophagaceae bacterium]
MSKLIKCFLWFLPLLVLISCKKSEDQPGTIFEQYFEKQVLNRPYIITNANDRGNDITAQYAGYEFVLGKGNDYYNGPLIATKGTSRYEGTWSSNEDYGKLIISLPSPPGEFEFLTRSWRFTSKNIPTLKFAPWGSTEDIQLTMVGQ